MIDIRLLRENPKIVEDDLKKRGRSIAEIERVKELDKEYRDLLFKIEKLRAERNASAKSVAALKQSGKDAQKEIKVMKGIGEEIVRLEGDVVKKKGEIDKGLMRLPNILHESVPKGAGEQDNAVVRKWGDVKENLKVKSHVDLLSELDIADLERASKISGARFYFLKNQLVLLELALARFALDNMYKKGFTLIEPPFLIRRKPYEAVTDLADFEDVLYKIEGEDLYLIATSEHPIGGMHMDEVLDEGKLPLCYAGWSTCFRKEAGAHGKDTKGIFRVHQFNKIEQFVFCRPEDSWKWHEKLIENAEELFKKLKLPYRIVNVCTGDIGTVAAKKYDLEVWMPAQKAYREAVSCSNCTEYQARRLNVRYGTEGQKPKGFVHTLNATAIATSRALVAIMENCQRPDGTIEVPKALQEYTGFSTIGKPKN